MYTTTTCATCPPPLGGYTPSADADTGLCLVRRFEQAVARPSAEAMALLDAATVALAASMRLAGMHPETAVVALKALLRGHAGTGWSPSIIAEGDVALAPPEAAIYDRLFASWVNAYYSGIG